MRRLVTLSACLTGMVWAAFLVSPSTQQLAWAQEDEPKARQLEADEEVDVEAIERRLDQIEQAIDQAETDDDDARVRELRREGERLLDQLETFERAQSEDDDFDERDDFEEGQLERHLRQLQLHRMELEVERMGIEIEVARQEAAARFVELATDEYALKAYALTQLAHGHEEPEETVEQLAGLLQETDSPVVTRLIRVRLARLYQEIDRPAQARNELRKLILND